MTALSIMGNLHRWEIQQIFLVAVPIQYTCSPSRGIKPCFGFIVSLFKEDPSFLMPFLIKRINDTKDA